MNEAEKERLIKKDIESIENRVRHAFNQGYEMGMKESRSEIPNTCGDAVSKQAVAEILLKYAHTMEGKAFAEFLVSQINDLPSVTPQQRTGRWKRISIDKYSEHAQYWYRCDKCGKDNLGNTDFCPNCGCKMEVEE